MDLQIGYILYITTILVEDFCARLSTTTIGYREDIFLWFFVLFDTNVHFFALDPNHLDRIR